MIESCGRPLRNLNGSDLIAPTPLTVRRIESAVVRNREVVPKLFLKPFWDSKRSELLPRCRDHKLLFYYMSKDLWKILNIVAVERFTWIFFSSWIMEMRKLFCICRSSQMFKQNLKAIHIQRGYRSVTSSLTPIFGFSMKWNEQLLKSSVIA